MRPEEMRRHLQGVKAGAMRHPKETIALAKAMLLAAPRISLDWIAERTGISISTLKRIRAGRLHKRLEPDPHFARVYSEALMGQSK